jgi:hypothetical protein
MCKLRLGYARFQKSTRFFGGYTTFNREIANQSFCANIMSIARH